MIIDTAIRTTIKCNHSKCTRLLRLDERKHSLHNANQLCRLFFHTQYSISRQQNGIKLATHHIRIHLEIAIFFQRPGSQGTIFLTHPLRTVITLKSTVQTIQHTVIVQTGIYMLVLIIQGNYLVLTRHHTQQRNPHPVLHTYHHILSPGSRLNDNSRLHPLKPSLGNAYPVALAQTIRLGYINRKCIGIRTGHPLQILHCGIGKVRKILPLPFPHPRQETEYRKTLHQLENITLGGTDKYIVEE